MSERLKEILKDIYAAEKGYNNNAKDRGGMTNWGITARTYQDCTGNNATEQVMRSLTQDDATPIYDKCTWKPIHGEALPRGLDRALMTLAGQYGVSGATKMLQEAIGVPADGVMGSRTLTAVQGYKGPNLVDALYRRHYLRSGNSKHFSKGLQNRAQGDWQLAAKDEGRSKDDIAAVWQTMPWYKAPPAVPLPPKRPEFLGSTPSEIRQRLISGPLSDTAAEVLVGPLGNNTEMRFAPQDKLPAPLPVDRFDKLPSKHSFLFPGREEEAPYTPLDDDEQEQKRQFSAGPQGGMNEGERLETAMNETSPLSPFDRIGRALSIMARNIRS